VRLDAASDGCEREWDSRKPGMSRGCSHPFRCWPIHHPFVIERRLTAQKSDAPLAALAWSRMNLRCPELLRDQVFGRGEILRSGGQVIDGSS